LETIFAHVKPELVYHLAAEFGRMNGEDYYEQLWITNCVGTRNVIEACLKHKARLAFASSSEAYGDADRYASGRGDIAEDFLDRFAPGFHNEYALTKWANERQISRPLRIAGWTRLFSGSSTLTGRRILQPLPKRSLSVHLSADARIANYRLSKLSPRFHVVGDWGANGCQSRRCGNI